MPTLAAEADEARYFYNLSVPLPNALLESFKQRIEAHEKKRARAQGK